MLLRRDIKPGASKRILEAVYFSHVVKLPPNQTNQAFDLSRTPTALSITFLKLQLLHAIFEQAIIHESKKIVLDSDVTIIGIRDSKSALVVKIMKYISVLQLTTEIKKIS